MPQATRGFASGSTSPDIAPAPVCSFRMRLSAPRVAFRHPPADSGQLSLPVRFLPGSNQLLLIRVNGADANGAGGSTVMFAPDVQTTFSSVSEIALTGGSGSVVYEVVSSNANVKEIAQIPMFLVAPQIPCTGNTVLPSITASLAPVSTVNVPTANDPIPRFVLTTPASDCQQNGDCTASYFPILSVDTTPMNLSGASLGNRQGATIAVSNAGGGIVSFTVAATYSNSAAFLTLSRPRAS